MRLEEAVGEIFRPVRWPIAHQVLNKLVKIAPVEIHKEICGQVFEYFSIISRFILLENSNKGVVQKEGNTRISSCK